MNYIVLPQISYAEALTTNVITFRGRAFKKVIKFKWCHKGEALIG